MEVDREEVKRHLEILGYKNIETHILNEFVEDLKKLIEYDQNLNVSSLLSSPNKDSYQSYIERIQSSSTPIKNIIVTNTNQNKCTEKQKPYIEKKLKYQNCTSPNSSKVIHKQFTFRKKNLECESKDSKELTCYICDTPMKKQKKRQNSNVPFSTYITAKFVVEL